MTEIFGDGLRVSLPTDQIVCADDSGAGARVGFSGMSFAGLETGQLIFIRVRELHRLNAEESACRSDHEPRERHRHGGR